MNNQKKSLSQKLFSLIAIVAVSLNLLSPGLVVAASISTASDVLSTNKVGVEANHTITFTTPTGVAAGETITVTFPAGWTMGAVDDTDMDLSDDASDLTLAAAANGATWGAAVAGEVITFTSDSGSIDAGSVIEIQIGTNAAGGANRITNSSSTGSHAIVIGGTQVDSGSMSVGLVTDPQVDVTANVDESLTLALSATTISFGTLTSATTGSGSMTLTVNTNAVSGYNITYEATALTHTDTVATIDAYSSAASAVGTEGWGINLMDNATPDVGADPGSTAGSGTPTPAGNYNTADTFHVVTGGTTTALASASGTAQDDVYTVSYVANVSGLTEAGDYSGTVDYQIYATF